MNAGSSVSTPQKGAQSQAIMLIQKERIVRICRDFRIRLLTTSQPLLQA
jgi:hypothetical protein